MTSYVVVGERSTSEWVEPDLSILDDRRGPVPSLPVQLLPTPWRDWISETAAAVAAPADYVMQSVLAGLIGVCGAGVRVRVTPTWSEPMVLWQAMVGEPSTGKSAALAPMRRLLDQVEQERRLHDDVRQEAHAEQAKKGGDGRPFVASQIVASDADLETTVEIVAGNPRGVVLWRDVSTVWLDGGCDGGRELQIWLEAWTASGVSIPCKGRPPRSLASFPVSILETMRPDRLKVALQEGHEGLAARYLYVWPGPQPYHPLAAQAPRHDDEVLQRLRHLSRLARTPDDPCELAFDDRGREALDGVLASLHAERLKADGPAAAWLGKGRSFIARLAGALELLASVDAPRCRPGAIGREQVETAAALWRNYFWPHAQAVFDCAGLSQHRQRVRRAARWLVEARTKSVTREDIRRRALALSATAEETNEVLYRLDYLGFVRQDPAVRNVSRGRPANRRLVNPALAST
ncbi:MAG: DUF3987 domain-containing protein [Alphaproteobacteria bacterium]|nr:DUF3987 domain-containing protein [Alphaproteobacteria bacterium]